MRKGLILLWVLVCSAAAFSQTATEGSLFAVGKQGKDLGECPLKTTTVKADISGFLARVRVRQEFENSFTEPIEAVYVFPLSQNGAVDDMTMTVGDRVIRGKIMPREEARKTYETAKGEGKTAGLLDQERPNIFTQSVANIMPGERVVIEISYVETLKYEDGAYEFVFPMVVAPRYIPGSVKGAAKISPPVAETRAGSDISIEVNLNAGVPIEEIRSSSHDVEQLNFTPNTAKINLKDEKTIPNKDFILRYDVTGKRIEDAVLAHRDERGGFFTLMLQPPDKIATEDRTPKEIVFLLDTSGSMGGFPIEKAKEAMKLSLDGLYPEDTFNLIMFSGDTKILFKKPVPATEANLEKAQAFLSEQQGYGGTEMMKAIKAALDPSDASDHLRIVCFMTDGEVGNDDEIIAEVQKHPKARVFSFGIGSSVNRSLLDKVAQEGNGEAEYVALEDDGSKAAKKFYERVRTPLLTDISIDWNGMPVMDIYPNKLSDLFSAKPVILHGRYTKAASGTIILKGKIAGQPYERRIKIDLPESEAANDVLATLWARTRIDQISTESLKAPDAAKQAEFNKQITDLGLEFRLLTQFTSFVAVEDKVVNQNGAPVTVQVPVELPAGMNRETTLGGTEVLQTDSSQVSSTINTRQLQNLPTNNRNPYGLVKLSGSRSTGGVAETVTVTAGGDELLETESSQVSTTINVDQMQRGNIGGGGGGGRSKPRKVKGSGTGSGSGSGQGSGSGNDSGDTGYATPPPPRSRGETVSGKATILPKPDYPAAARGVKADGLVTVQIVIDQAGNVTSASAISGHPLLRTAAEQAARQAKFGPSKVNGVPQAVRGMINYIFTDPEKTGSVQVTTDRPSDETTMSPEPNHDAMLKAKLHRWLYAVVARLSKGDKTPTANESMFVAGDKANVTVELSANSPAVIEKLKAAGFEVTREKGKTLVIGKIALDKLADLALIDEVKLVLPVI